MDATSGRVQFERQIFFWHRLVDYLCDEKRFLAHCYHVLATGNDLSVGELSRLKAQSQSSCSIFDQCEADVMLGMMAFRVRKHQTSLIHLRRVLQVDSKHMEVLPVIVWNCLLLGLASDAQAANRQYRLFHRKPVQESYWVLMRPALRWASMIQVLESFQVGHLGWMDGFWARWAFQEDVPDALFDFDVIWIIDAFLRTQAREGRRKVQEMYRRFPNEWIPSLLMAIVAFGDRDDALCFDMSQCAVSRAPKNHHRFLTGMQNAMILGLQTL